MTTTAATEHDDLVVAGKPFLRVNLADVEKHPGNPRHRATADTDMVASVKSQGLLQPLVLAPILGEDGTASGKWRLIAGHRRTDALKKAKLKTAPAYIRWDLTTEAQQIEAMLVENGHRADLTPIEEAEGYQQLTLLGYSQKAIAAAVGRDAKTVRARLRLLKLQPSTRKKVHAGQLRLEDAAAITEFADDPAATKRLEAATKGHTDNLRYQLQRERRRAAGEVEVAKTEAKLLDRGATEHKLGDNESFWSMKKADRLSQTHSTDWGQHQGCLGYVKLGGDQWTTPSIEPVCTDPAKHRDQLEAEQRERLEAAEKQREQAFAKETESAAAADVRIQTVMELVGTDTRLPGAVADLTRALLPLLVADLYDGLDLYQDAMGVDADSRWAYVSEYRESEARRPHRQGQPRPAAAAGPPRGHPDLDGRHPHAGSRRAPRRPGRQQPAQLRRRSTQRSGTDVPAAAARGGAPLLRRRRGARLDPRPGRRCRGRGVLMYELIRAGLITAEVSGYLMIAAVPLGYVRGWWG